MSARTDGAEADSVRHWMAEVSRAAAAFERRWTRRALSRVDPGLAKRLYAQVQDFDRVCVTGSVEEVERQGAATCRGYGVCCKALEGAQEPDDAYVLGFDAATGFKVAIGHQRAAADRVIEMHGSAVVWISPDEVAGIFAGMESLKTVMAIKRRFPGAEIVERYPDEPAQMDAAE